MRKMEISTRLWKQGLAALGVLAGLALAPAPAQAQICGEPDEIASDLLDVYFDTFGDSFVLDSDTCNAMAKVFLQACNSAVKDAVKCADRQIDSIPKAAKPYCKEFSKNPSDCDKNFKDDAEEDKDFVDGEAADAYDECNEARDLFVNVCRFDV